MIAHVRTDSSARNRHRSAKRDTVIAFALCGVPLFLFGFRSVAIFVAPTKSEIWASAMQRSCREQFRLALLPGQAFGRYDIKRNIDHVKQAVLIFGPIFRP